MPRAVTQQGAVIISVAKAGDHPESPIEVHVSPSKHLSESDNAEAAIKKAFTIAANHIASEFDCQQSQLPAIKLVVVKPNNAIQIGIIVKRATGWVLPDMYIPMPRKQAANPENLDLTRRMIDTALSAATAAMKQLSMAA